MIHTNRCKHCGKTREEHILFRYCVRENEVGNFTDSGLAALDAHKEELYEAVKKYIDAYDNTALNAYNELEDIMNQIYNER